MGWCYYLLAARALKSSSRTLHRELLTCQHKTGRIIIGLRAKGSRLDVRKESLSRAPIPDFPNVLAFSIVVVRDHSVGALPPPGLR